jgi:hypothetical protein
MLLSLYINNKAGGLIYHRVRLLMLRLPHAPSPMTCGTCVLCGDCVRASEIQIASRRALLTDHVT